MRLNLKPLPIFRKSLQNDFMKETSEFLKKEIKEHWQEHIKAKFPNVADVNSIVLVSLDADIAGCIASFIDVDDLNLFQTATLGLCYKQVSFVIEFLDEESADYFRRLEKLSELVLKAVAKNHYAEHISIEQ